MNACRLCSRRDLARCLQMLFVTSPTIARVTREKWRGRQKFHLCVRCKGYAAYCEGILPTRCQFYLLRRLVCSENDFNQNISKTPIIHTKLWNQWTSPNGSIFSRSKTEYWSSDISRTRPGHHICENWANKKRCEWQEDCQTMSLLSHRVILSIERQRFSGSRWSVCNEFLQMSAKNKGNGSIS